MRTILLSGLRKSDELVFSSLLTLLSKNTEEKWTVITNGNSDIAVVDVDNPNGASFAKTLEKCGRQVIRLTAHSDTKEHGLWIHKPVRSTEILKCIAAINQLQVKETETSAITQESNENVIRLRRWPTRDIVKSFPEANRLCAVLIRRALTIEEALELSNLSRAALMDFIGHCKSQRCLQVGKVRDSSKFSKTVTTPSNFFTKLRHKLTSKV